MDIERQSFFTEGTIEISKGRRVVRPQHFVDDLYVSEEFKSKMRARLKMLLCGEPVIMKDGIQTNSDYFTPTELEELTESLKSPGLSAKIGDDVWRRAFAKYNMDHPERTLSMHCSPCYPKVFLYIKSFPK